MIIVGLEKELDECWKIMKCGREKFGAKVGERGECPASALGLVHYCWTAEGPLCDGESQGVYEVKIGKCMRCEVYRRYNPMSGRDRDEVQKRFSEEHRRYAAFIQQRMKDRLGQ